MENNENNDFNYVQEKIKPRNKRRLKKVLAVIGLTIVAAVIFGFVSRLVFVTSEGTVNKLLGITPSPVPTAGPGQTTNRNEVKLGNPTKAPTSTPTPTPGTAATKGAADTAPAQKITSTPTDGADEDSGTEGGQKNENSSESSTQTGSASDVVTTKVPTLEPTATSEPTNEPVPTPPDNSDGKADNGENPEAGTGQDNRNTGDESDNADDGENSSEGTDALDSPLAGYIKMMSELRKVAGKASEAIVRVYSVTSGINWLDESVETRQELSGVLLGENGVELLVLTDYSSVSASDRIEVEFADGSVNEAVLFSSDADLGLAILAIPEEAVSENSKYGFIKLGDSGMLYDGEPVIAIGRPNGYFGAVEFGFVSHKGLSKYFVDGAVDEFTTDILISGNGDSLIVSLDGSLVGIVSMTASELNSEKTCVVGINGLKTALLKLLNGIEIPYLGLRSENIPDDVLGNMGLENGIYVNEAVAGSPASEAGIKKGDVIVGMDGVAIGSVSEYYDYLMSLEAGSEVEVKIFRSSRKEAPEETIKIRVGKK